MGFFNRLFKKVEDINKGEVAVSELESEFYLESPVEEAKGYWVEMAQNIIVNTVKATNNSVERAFVLIDFGEQPSFDIFYQVDGSLVMWHQLEHQDIKEKIEYELLPQATDVVKAVNDNFIQANHSTIAFAELQFEWQTSAWFSHIIWEDDEYSKLAKDEILNKWFDTLSVEVKDLPLDSDTKLSWYP
ncbi:hypothetical protein [Psychrobacillus sp. MER TA 171]|uniref:hypothetical protein n=1 Tax=Psychrobacillus sp. MER TA 171 TaxID=2939577 RepID=UPI00203A805A|nr:hypothetical protein [Psychrobacillus sp. MER TA 171]MCM3357703.1 hypothetical protein [Psychrobacillus sp. MER TA 171]